MFPGCPSRSGRPGFLLETMWSPFRAPHLLFIPPRLGKCPWMWKVQCTLAIVMFWQGPLAHNLDIQSPLAPAVFWKGPLAHNPESQSPLAHVVFRKDPLVTTLSLQGPMDAAGPPRCHLADPSP